MSQQLFSACFLRILFFEFYHSTNASRRNFWQNAMPTPLKFSFTLEFSIPQILTVLTALSSNNCLHWDSHKFQDPYPMFFFFLVNKSPKGKVGCPVCSRYPGRIPYIKKLICSNLLDFFPISPGYFSKMFLFKNYYNIFQDENFKWHLYNLTLRSGTNFYFPFTIYLSYSWINIFRLWIRSIHPNFFLNFL